MKTYLFDTINRFKRFSKQLDVKTIICDKAWQVFNDSGEKELYIFNTDGTVLITLNGVVTHGTWQFIAANDSLIITAASQSYMVHPAFLDDCLFALQVDGTDQVAFLIDQKNSQSFAPKTYQQVIDYFANKEKQEKKQIELKRKQEEEIRIRKVEKDRLLREQEEIYINRNREKAEKERRKKEIEPVLQEFERKFRLSNCLTTIMVIIAVTAMLFSVIDGLSDYDSIGLVVGIIVIIVDLVAVIVCINGIFSGRELLLDRKEHYMKYHQKYIEEHPDDPRNAYLKQYIETELK